MVDVLDGGVEEMKRNRQPTSCMSNTSVMVPERVLFELINLQQKTIVQYAYLHDTCA